MTNTRQGTIPVDDNGAVPVAISSATVTLDASDVEIGAVELKNATTDDRATISAAGALKVDGSAAVQPVSGTVTVQDGGNVITVDGTVTANAGTGPFPVSDNGGSLTVDDGAGSLTVDGTVTANLAAGTNNIGDVDVLTQPARARTTDHIGAADMTDVVMNGTTAITPKFAVIDHASADNTLVSAVASKKIRVVALVAVASGGENTIRFESGTGGTALTGQMQISDNGGFVLPYNPVGWFETAANTLLNMELGAATSVDGVLTYLEV